MKSWNLVALTVAGLASALMACSSSTTEPAPGSSGTGSGQGSSKGSGSGSTTGGGGGGCFLASGSGDTETCEFSSEIEGMCPGTYAKGSCPSSGLIGCCAQTTDGESSGACYYTTELASAAQMGCTEAKGTWTTSAP